MQELTREVSNANVAFNVCELNHRQQHKLDMSPNVATTKANSQELYANGTVTLLAGQRIKLENGHEHMSETAAWQARPDFNANSKLLLQGSDDPLICHGANNDAHDEDHPFRLLLARKSQEQRAASNGACSTLTKQQLKVKASLMSARKSYKQAPPVVPEIAINSQSLNATRQSKPKKRQGAAGTLKLRFHHQALPAEYLSHYEATQGRQVSAAKPAQAMPNLRATPNPSGKQSHENVRSWLRKIAEIQRSAERQRDATTAQLQTSSPAPMPTPEAAPAETAPNKRAALRYADLPYMGEITLDNYKPRRGRKPKKADICHLIYKNYGTVVPVTAPIAGATAPTAAIVKKLLVQTKKKSAEVTLLEEPLNLCLRDQSSDRYSISSGDSDKPSTLTVTTTATGSSSPFGHSQKCEKSKKPLQLQLPEEQTATAAAKLLLQPVGLYYQQLMESCALGLPVETIEKDNQLALKIPIPSGFLASSSSSCNGKRDTDSSLTLRKRKRSAIFIPPMPTEHSSSPTTEVSICKFKFTGGAKPTLQEKKMLSVDAEGNYRYYSGTGDKAMRGYEFISREQQQQQQQLMMVQPSNEGNDKLYIDIPPPSTDLSLELLNIPPESPTASLLMSANLTPVATPQSPASNYSSSRSPMPSETCLKSRSEFAGSPMPASKQTETEHKRRSSRRSKQREKLEKTFKEKGFLIQTQQLQSAEGATYCKFRQLKKFTRYLFRNWKDHIPESDLVRHQVSGNHESHGIIENLLSGQQETPIAAITDQVAR